MGYDDIKDKGFDKRTTGELLEITRKGGKASGEARRRKADFRRTLNHLLTMEISDDDWAPTLRAMGIDPTLESALNMKMILEALAGNVKAAHYVAQYAGQSAKSEADEREQEARVEKFKAETEKINNQESTQDEALDKLDSILAGVEKVMRDD